MLIKDRKKQGFSLFSAGNLGGLASVGLPAVGRSLSTGGNWGNTVGLTILLVSLAYLKKDWTVPNIFCGLTLAEISDCHTCKLADLQD